MPTRRQAAISARRASSSCSCCPSSRCHAASCLFSHASAANEEEICILALDDVAEGGGGGGSGGASAFTDLRTALRAATLLKIDIQGHEGLAMRGMRRRVFAADSRIHGAHIEITPAVTVHKGVDPLEIYQTLRDAGFEQGALRQRGAFKERVIGIGSNMASFIDLVGTRKVASAASE